MLLPTKGISAERALLTIGSQILDELRHPLSVSALWARFGAGRRLEVQVNTITFDWFALALSALFAMGLVSTSEDGFIRRSNVS